MSEVHSSCLVSSTDTVLLESDTVSIKRIIASMAALVAIIAMTVLSAGSASAAPTTQAAFNPFRVACANEGPAQWWPAADYSTRRNCWWGYEQFYSKNDTKLIATGAGGAIGGLASTYLPTRVAVLVLAGATGGVSGEKINQIVDGGKCLKVTVIYPGAVFPAAYNCY